MTSLIIVAALLSDAGLQRHEASGIVYWTSAASQKPPLVLLHGANEHSATWASVAPLLAADYRLIIPDLAGHGESEPKKGEITYKAMLDGIAAVVAEEIPDGKFTLAGNSMGGWLAMLYTFDHSDRVERLVLEDASGMAWMLNVPLTPKTREEAAQVMRAVHGPEANAPAEALDAFLAQKDLPMSRMNMLDALGYLVDKRLSEIKVPVTLIWGRDDGVLPLAYAEALQKKIEGSTLIVIDGAAHIPHKQQPKRFVQCLKATC